MRLIDVQPISQAVNQYIEQGNSWNTIARELGFVSNGKPESRRVKIMLGLTKNGRGKMAESITYESAVLILHAIGRDPVDFGI